MDFAFSIFRRWNRRWKQWTWSTPTTMWHCWDLAKTTTPLWGSLLSLGWSAPWCRRRKSWWQRKRSRLCGRFAKNMWLVARYFSVLLRSSKLSLEIFFRHLLLVQKCYGSWPVEIMPTYQNCVHKSYSSQTLLWKYGDSANVLATFLGFLNQPCNSHADFRLRSLTKSLFVWTDDSGEPSWQDSFFSKSDWLFF